MTDTEGGAHCSSIVWTEHGGDAQRYLEMDKKDFDAALQQRFGDQLGRVKHIGQVMVYPLSLMHAKRYTAPRLALIGEARQSSASSSRVR